MADAGEGSDGRERRRAPRFAPDQLPEPVFVVGTRLITIGALGLMMEAPVPLAPDSSLRFRLVLEGEKAEVEGRVRSCVPRPPAWGIGIEFEKLSPSARDRLERLLTRARRGSA